MSNAVYVSVAPWEYRDPAGPLEAIAMLELPEPVPAIEEAPRFSEEEVQERLRVALAESHARWETQALRQQAMAEETLAQQLQVFGEQRAAYFRQAEAELVQLVLGITRKILQREAALDPALLRGLVRVAIDRLGSETPVQLRVAPEALTAWQGALAKIDGFRKVELASDATLGATDCVVESGAALASLSLELQLKEIEQSFQDLMARRPDLTAL